MFRQHFTPRRITEYALHARDNSGLSRECAGSLFDHAGIAFSGRWLRKIVAPGLVNCWVTGFRRKSEPLILIPFIGQNFAYRPYQHHRCRQSECAERDAFRARNASFAGVVYSFFTPLCSNTRHASNCRCVEARAAAKLLVKNHCDAKAHRHKLCPGHPADFIRRRAR